MPVKGINVEKPCVICGTMVSRCPSQMLKIACCGLICSRKYLSQKMSKLNKELNPDRMTDEVKQKLSSKRRGGPLKSKTYPKINSRHAHRVMAEEILGRALLPGEIVHHVDENRNNFAKDNLMIFASQGEHNKHHAKIRREKRNNPDNWDI